MEKKFYSNLDYNKSKRRSSIILSVLLVICLFGTSSLFFARKEYFFGILFLVPLFIPLMAIPSTFKTFPTSGKPTFIVKDKEIQKGKETFNIKDIVKINITISLPASKLDSENKLTLEKFKKEKPEETFLGDFDIVVKGADNKHKTYYSSIENPIEALTLLLEKGIKHYVLRYTIKKFSVINEFDLKNDIESIKQKEFSNATKKQKNRQLL